MTMSPARARRRGRPLALALAAFLSLAAGAAVAQGPAPAAGSISATDASTRSQQIADVLRSPFCPGKTLLTCTSGQAFTARQEIRDRLVAGEPEESIIEDFKTRYGDNIVNPPQPWYAVVSPFIPALVGVLVLAVVTWRWRKGKGDAAPASPEPEAGGADAERLARLRRQVSAEDD
jgi:cytochrome c-type biogenesis protein CcmH/NrfF